DDVLALLGGQLARVALTRRRQAVHTGQIAGVGELPGQADRRVEALLELLDQPRHGCGCLRLYRCCARHGRSSFGTSMRDAASTPSACRYGFWSASSIPAARQAARALGCSPSDCTTPTMVRFFRNDSLRVPKWYSRAPNGSGRTATCGCS